MVQVERYIYFPVDAVRFEATQPAWLERGSDESAAMGALHSIAGVLQQAHALAFAQVRRCGAHQKLYCQIIIVHRFSISKDHACLIAPDCCTAGCTRQLARS